MQTTQTGITMEQVISGLQHGNAVIKLEGDELVVRFNISDSVLNDPDIPKSSKGTYKFIAKTGQREMIEIPTVEADGSAGQPLLLNFMLMQKHVVKKQTKAEQQLQAIDAVRRENEELKKQLQETNSKFDQLLSLMMAQQQGK